MKKHRRHCKGTFIKMVCVFLAVLVVLQPVSSPRILLALAAEENPVVIQSDNSDSSDKLSDESITPKDKPEEMSGESDKKEGDREEKTDKENLLKLDAKDGKDAMENLENSVSSDNSIPNDNAPAPMMMRANVSPLPPVQQNEDPSTTYVISVFEDTGGSVSPNGTVTVNAGDDQTFTITPDPGYIISDVQVDGISLGPVTSYTFHGVDSNQSISAFFYTPSNVSYTIHASAGTGGSISPSGDVAVTSGTDQIFNITPDPGYIISDVLVDGISVGPITNYTFANVSADGTISASFDLTPIVTYTINASAGAGGTITPSGSVVVNAGADQAFDIAPDPGYVISDVLVDGISVGAVSNYTFTNVQTDATITASFSLAPVLTYTITSSAGPGGTINPDGAVTVNAGADQGFIIIPDPGYIISDVVVDGISVGAVSNYTFTNVQSDGSISVTFNQIPVTTYTIHSSAGAGGTITPSGSVTVNAGADQTFDIAPDPGYIINDVLVDGISVGAVASYTFTNVQADATIEASFSVAPILTYVIHASAGVGGSISPSGDVVVNVGANQTFDVTLDSGYVISDVLVDGISVGAVSNYTFTSVSADATIEAIFSLTSVPPSSGSHHHDHHKHKHHKHHNDNNDDDEDDEEDMTFPYFGTYNYLPGPDGEPMGAGVVPYGQSETPAIGQNSQSLTPQVQNDQVGAVEGASVENKTSTEKSSSFWIWILGGIVFLGGVGWYLWKRRNLIGE